MIGSAYGGLGFDGVFVLMVIVLAIGGAAILIFRISTAGRLPEDINELQAADQIIDVTKES